MINTGKYLSLDFDDFKLNMMGSIYIGPSNPIENTGFDIVVKKPTYNYDREPQDLVDASARAHDLGYDFVGAEGAYGATMDKRALQADIQLVRSANKVIDMYAKKEIDPFTKNPISKETLERAKKVVTLFSVLCKIKGIDKTESIIKQKAMSQALDVWLSNIDLTIDDVINPVDIKGKKQKTY